MKGFTLLIDGMYPCGSDIWKMSTSRCNYSSDFLVLYFKMRKDLEEYLDYYYNNWKSYGAIVEEIVPSWYVEIPKLMKSNFKKWLKTTEWVGYDVLGEKS